MFHGLQNADMTFTGRDGLTHHLGDKLSEPKMMILGLMLGLMVISLTLIRYTLWGVVATLAMIEEPQYTYRLRVEKSATSTGVQADVHDAEAEVDMVKAKPITASIRATVRHLVQRAGRLARYRGISCFVVYALVHQATKNLLVATPRLLLAHVPMWGHALASVVASAILCQLSAAWVHIVISEPSSKRWYQRIPDNSTWKHLWAPTVAVDAITRLAFVLPVLCARILGLTAPDANEQPLALNVFKIGVCAALGLLTLVSLFIPAVVVLVRIQASLLPEEHETIVSFDRTFGGKVQPEIVGGSGAVGFVDAWATFNLAARWRIVKMFFKFVFIETFLHIFYAATIVAVAVLFIGPNNIRDFLKDRHL